MESNVSEGKNCESGVLTTRREGSPSRDEVSNGQRVDCLLFLFSSICTPSQVGLISWFRLFSSISRKRDHPSVDNWIEVTNLGEMISM